MTDLIVHGGRHSRGHSLERRPVYPTEQDRVVASSARRDEGVWWAQATEEQRGDAQQIRGLATEGKPVVALALPGDKSISHRALIVACAAPGPTRIKNLNRSSSVRPLVDALTALGVDMAAAPPTDVVVGTLSRDSTGPRHLDCGASSAAARLLLGALAALGVPAILDGNEVVRVQPMSWVVDPLRALGATIEYRGAPGCLPVLTRPSALCSGSVTMAVGSAQARSAMLMAAALAGISVHIRYGVRSRDHTERLLGHLGVAIEDAGDVLTIHGTGPMPVAELGVPGDPSSLAYPAAAHVLSGTEEPLICHGVCLNPTRTGFLELLREMGVNVVYEHVTEQYGEPVGTVRIGPRPAVLGPFAIREPFRFHALIDEVPVAFALATQASGESILEGGGELRFKETNRLESTRAMLAAFGADVGVAGDGLWVRGGRRLRCGQVPSFGDHRIAMAAAALASCLPGATRISGGGCYVTSFPDFVECMREGGWDMTVERSR